MEELDKLVRNITEVSPNCKLYKSYDSTGRLTKQLELIDGKWVDVTEQELEKIQLEKEILDSKNLLKRFGENDL